MKSRALELAAKQESPAQKLNVVREYIQACTLRSLHESEAFEHLSFVGGTALRFLYELPRFSEDLDFSLENPLGYQPEKWFKKLKIDLTFQGFAPTVTLRQKTNVHVVWLRFSHILQELNLSAVTAQKLSVKIEIDTMPPAGGVTESKVLNRPFLFVIRHHLLSSLFAGKVHALLTRKFSKGRDWYDLLWYLTNNKNLAPEKKLLQNALLQTGHDIHAARVWKKELFLVISQLDWKKISQDVEPFLEREGEADLLNHDVFSELLRPES